MTVVLKLQLRVLQDILDPLVLTRIMDRCFYNAVTSTTADPHRSFLHIVSITTVYQAFKNELDMTSDSPLVSRH